MFKQAGSAGGVVSINQQIACLERELTFRRRVYPNWVAQNKIRDEDATREIRQMQAAVNSLRKLAHPLNHLMPDIRKAAAREDNDV